ncbi:MAG: ABC transporter substrate-binding protein [Sediminispirochaetaceae bacterium]
MRKKLLSAACLCGLILFASTPAMADPSIGSDPDTAFPVEIVDSIGNRVLLKERPRRIVLAGRATLTTANVFYLFEEARAKVAAIGHTDQGLGTFLPYLDAGFSAIPELPHEVGPEEVAAQRPDLVIVKNFAYSRLGTPLKKLGIPVIALSLETPEQFQQDIEILGKALGCPERAAEIRDTYRRRMTDIETRMEGLTEDEKPRVLLLYYNTKGGNISYNIAPAGWIQTLQVRAAGGNPVWAESHIGSGWKTVNFEQIAAWDPDYIFVTSYRIPTAAFFQEMLNSPQWQHIRAARSGRVFAFPADFYSWAQPDVRWILGVQWLSKILHPDLCRDLDIKVEIETFYRDMYGLSSAEFRSIVEPRITGIE